jgi:hypothetical protein
MKLVKELIYFLITSIVVLLLCEAFIRFSNLGTVSSTEFYEDQGKGKRKNMSYAYFNEGFGIVNYNEFGFIGESIKLKKDNKTLRVALLGDSFIESLQVFNRDYFGKIAENNLNERNTGSKYEILNFGRSGIGFSDMYISQKSLVEKFDPDIIIYFISNGDLYRRHIDKLLPKIKLDTSDQGFSIDYAFDKTRIERYNARKGVVQNSAFLNMTKIAVNRLKQDYLELILGKFGSFFEDDGKPVVKEGNSSRDEKKEITYKIMESLDKKKTIFINRDNESLPNNFVDSIAKYGFRFYDFSEMLKITPDEKQTPYYWKVTGKQGHWNYNTHQFLAKELINIIQETETK